MIRKLLIICASSAFLAGCGKQCSEPTTPMPYHDPKDEIKLAPLPASLKNKLERPAAQQAGEARFIEKREGLRDPLVEYQIYENEQPDAVKNNKGPQPIARF